jgi:hypothetical protein
MKIKREHVLYYLKEKEKERGGYYVADIAILAKELEVRWYSVQNKLYRYNSHHVKFFRENQIELR